jgi:NAD(P)-dependent dehydrogenase (short-subunit alcohol dehydrogenase family)
MITRRAVLQSGSLLALGSMLPGCASTAKRGAPVAFADIPRSDYGFETTAADVAAGYDLSGMTVLITGCNSGLGYESMKSLAGRGAHVIGTARTAEKAKTACDSVEGRTTPLVCELTDMDSVVRCANAVNGIAEPIDVLMCNAGIMALPELEQVDVNGVTLEKQFVVNHLGHYLLTRRLLPQVMDADKPRIVMLSSSGYTLAPKEGIVFDNLSWSEGYQPFKAYGQTKLANALMAKDLSRRYFADGLDANAVHPGLVGTNLGRYISGKPRDPDEPLRKGFKTPEQGAATQVYVAIDTRLADASGYYFEDCNPSEMKGANASDMELASQLWDVSEQLVRAYL